MSSSDEQGEFMRVSRKLVAKYTTLFSILALVLTYNACGAGMPVDVPGITDQIGSATSDLNSSVDMNNQEAVREKALQILATNCAGCHTASTGPAGVFGLADANHLISSGLIIPGQPDQSRILIAIEGNRMPPTSALGASDKQVIRTWIAGGGASPSSPLPPVVTPLPPAPPSAPPTGTLEQKAIAILQKNCFSCHGTLNSGNLTNITDPANLISRQLILLSNPSQSPLYLKITVGNMPLGGAKLNQTDTDIILAWITAGAKAPAAGTVPPPPQLPPLAPTYKSLSANIFLPKCAGCHSGANPPEGVLLDNYTSLRRNLSDALEEISDGEMPRGGPPLTAAEQKAIRDWQAAGAPNN